MESPEACQSTMVKLIAFKNNTILYDRKDALRTNETDALKVKLEKLIRALAIQQLTLTIATNPTKDIFGCAIRNGDISRSAFKRQLNNNLAIPKADLESVKVAFEACLNTINDLTTLGDWFSSSVSHFVSDSPQTKLRTVIGYIDERVKANQNAHGCG
jgi:hypothetical protein